MGARLNRNEPRPTLWSANKFIIPPTAQLASQTRRGSRISLPATGMADLQERSFWAERPVASKEQILKFWLSDTVQTEAEVENLERLMAWFESSHPH